MTARGLVLLLAGAALVVLCAVFVAGRVRPDSAPDVRFEGVTEVTKPDATVGLTDVPAASDPIQGPTRQRANESKPTRSRRTGRASIDLRVVRDEDGEPIRAASVHAAGRKDDSRASDAEGRVRLEDLAPPTAIVYVSAEGRASDSLRVHVEDGKSTAAEMRLVAERTVRVRILTTSGDEFLPGRHGLSPADVGELDIIAAPSCAPLGHAPPSTGLGGVHVSGAPKDGEALAWTLRVRGVRGHWIHLVLGETVLAAEFLAPGVTDLDLPLGLASIDRSREPVLVLVVDGSGAPIPGAEVRMSYRMGGFAMRRTDDEGRARFDERTFAAVRLTVRSAAYATRYHKLVRPRDGEVEIALSPARRVHGIVRDEAGSPLPRARLEVHALGPDGRTFEREPRLTASASREGRFLVDGLEGGRYLFTLAIDEERPSADVEGPHASDEVLVDCTERDVADVELRRVARIVPAPRPTRAVR